MADRSAEEVYRHHAAALLDRDLDAIVSDYAEDAVLITGDGVLRGRAGVRQAFMKVLHDLPDAKWDVRTRIVEGQVLYLEWTVTAPGTRADDGVETFLVRDGEIVLQTIHYTLMRLARLRDV
jgi:ketosteroid isomerase-like protein